jgi:hypothetical protein
LRLGTQLAELFTASDITILSIAGLTSKLLESNKNTHVAARHALLHVVWGGVTVAELLCLVSSLKQPSLCLFCASWFVRQEHFVVFTFRFNKKSSDLTALSHNFPT